MAPRVSVRKHREGIPVCFLYFFVFFYRKLWYDKKWNIVSWDDIRK